MSKSGAFVAFAVPTHSFHSSNALGDLAARLPSAPPASAQAAAATVAASRSAGDVFYPIAGATAIAALLATGRRRPRERRRSTRHAVNLKIPPATVASVVPEELMEGKYVKEAEVAIQLMMDAMHVANMTTLLQEEEKDKTTVGLRGEELEKLYVRKTDTGGDITITNVCLMALFGKNLLNEFPDDLILCDDDAKILSRDEALAVTTTGILQKLDLFKGEDVSKFESALWVNHCGSYNEKVGDGPPPSRYWALSPVDMTEDFRKMKPYCISLALIVDHKPVLGVIGCPVSAFDHCSRSVPSSIGSPICFAVQGAGAYTQMVEMRRNDGVYQGQYRLKGKSIRLNVVDKIKRSNDGLYDALGSQQISIAMPVHSRQDIFHDAQALGKRLGSDYPKFDISDSAIKHVFLARGETDMVWYFPRGLFDKGATERLVHHAAGALIAEESGAIVSDLDGKPIDWCGPILKENRGFVATDPNKVPLQGVTDAVVEATEKSVAAYEKRVAKRIEVSKMLKDLFENLGDFAETEEEVKGCAKVKELGKKYLKDDEAMMQDAQDQINRETPILGEREAQPGDDAFDPGQGGGMPFPSTGSGD